MSARILVIDDEPNWMNFARYDLGSIFEVRIASDLKTVLARLKKKSFDLVIASSSCTDALEAITKKYPGKRVIVATGQPTTREAIEMYRLGAFDYFAKDFRSDVMSRIVQEALQKPVVIPA